MATELIFKKINLKILSKCVRISPFLSGFGNQDEMRILRIAKREVNFNLRNSVHTNGKYFTQVRKEDAKIVDGSDRNSKQMGDRVFTIPNILCVARIAFSPVISYAIVTSQFPIALGLLTFAAITDFVDGYVARNYANQASKIGSFLDPLADKVLAACVFIPMSFANLIPVWLVALIVIRDVGLMLAAAFVRITNIPKSQRSLRNIFSMDNGGVQLSPTYISKVNTALCLGCAFGSLAFVTPQLAFLSPLLTQQLLQISWYAAGSTTILSALSYAIYAKKTYKVI